MSEDNFELVSGNMLGWCAKDAQLLGEKLQPLAEVLGYYEKDGLDGIPLELEDLLFDKAIDIAHEIDCKFTEEFSLDSDNFRIVYLSSNINGYECFGLFISKGDLSLIDYQDLLSFSHKVFRKIIKNSNIEKPLFFPAMSKILT